MPARSETCDSSETETGISQVQVTLLSVGPIARQSGVFSARTFPAVRSNDLKTARSARRGPRLLLSLRDITAPRICSAGQLPVRCCETHYCQRPYCCQQTSVAGGADATVEPTPKA